MVQHVIVKYFNTIASSSPCLHSIWKQKLRMTNSFHLWVMLMTDNLPLGHLLSLSTSVSSANLSSKHVLPPALCR